MHTSAPRSPSKASLSLGPLLVSLPLPLLLPMSCLLAQTPVHAQKAATPPAGATNTNGDELVGLPAFLLAVPGGPVQVGLTAEQLVAAACQSVSPIKPELAPRYTEKMVRAMRLCSSMLGQQQVTVDTFLLGKAPITNAQYEVYVKAMTARGTPVRMPFHWWSEGCLEDYNKHLEDIKREFPKADNPAVEYWERHWAELPSKVQDRKGNSIANTPVSYVSMRDVNAFAAWLGMRLPSEDEMTRAMRGDGKNVWPWGASRADVYTEDVQGLLQLGGAPKAVGTVPAMTGPFGHTDLFGNVFQFVSDIGYTPINGREAFSVEWKKLQKDRVGKVLEAADVWKDTFVLAKGGCYLSAGEPITLLLDQRAKFQTIDVLEGLGFRLAKSLRPGYDMMLSLVRSGLYRDHFAKDQDISMTAQVGAERYEMGADGGFPSAYHAVTFAPVNWLTNDKSLDAQKLVDLTWEKPLLLGVLASTEAMLAPQAKAGLYQVLYRKEGMPRDLAEAIKTGIKEVHANAKKKPKGDKDKKDDKKEEPTDEKADKKASNWEAVLARHGLKPADLEGKKSAEEIKFVRIDETEVPTDSDCLLLVDNEGKIAAAQPIKAMHFATGNPSSSTLAITSDTKGKVLATFAFSSANHDQNPQRAIATGFQITLDQAAPDAATPWRQQ